MDALMILLFALAGGLVGYLTNAVAVWMLFHPVRPRCFWRLCLQGLVPARRVELAERMARVVAERLSGGFMERGMGRLEESLRGLLRDAIASMIGPRFSVLAVLGGGGVVEELSDKLAEAMAPRIMRLVRAAASRMDLAGLIAEEFMEASVEDMERMFWEVAGRELRFIEAMGFVLGFIVGLVEGVLAYLVA